MRPYTSLFIFMDCSGSLCVVFISLYAFFWVLIGPYSPFYVRMESNMFLWVLISPYSILWILVGPYKFLCILINSKWV